MDIVKVFASNLKKYRTPKVLSQENFAEMSGLIEHILVRLIPFIMPEVEMF